MAQPKARDDIVRAPHIPEGALSKKKYDKNDPDRRRLQRDIELEEGGAGVFNINMKRTCSFISPVFVLTADRSFYFNAEDYLLANPEWKMDTMPEIMNGKNVADFIDPDIAEKLEALEREEEKLQAEGFYDNDEAIVSTLWPPFYYPCLIGWYFFLQLDSDDEREAIEARSNLAHKMVSQSIKKSKKNQSRLPRTAGLRTITDLSTEMTAAGLDPSRIVERAAVLAKVQGAKRKRAAEMDVDMDMEEGGEGDEGDWMDVDGDEESPNKRAKGVSGGIVPLNRREARTDRRFAGIRDDAVCSSSLTMGYSGFDFGLIFFRYTAIVESHQVAEPWTTTSQPARESRRRRSCYQNENGTSS